MTTLNLPIRRLSRVYHVGTLDLAQKGVRGPSLEGAGLSVSLHPQEWTRIAKLGDGLTFEMSRPEGTFLDFYKGGHALEQELTTWGLSEGLCQMEPRWKLSWTDAESDEVLHIVLASHAQAQSELAYYEEDDDTAASVEEIQVPVLTASAIQRLGFATDPLNTLSMLATFFVEDCLDLDGVWWNDDYAPARLSAPRGVIVPSRVQRWTAAKR